MLLRIPWIKNSNGNKVINEIINKPLKSVPLKLSILEKHITVIKVINNAGNNIVIRFLAFIIPQPFLKFK